jgi:hypothetical protein
MIQRPIAESGLNYHANEKGRFGRPFLIVIVRRFLLADYLNLESALGFRHCDFENCFRG